MPVASMTGFARADAVADEWAVVWEVRSVNGKGLDMRLRLPPGHDRLEPAVRQEIQKRFARGNIQATLTVERSGEAAASTINHALLIRLAGVARELVRDHGAAPPTADGLLALRGVLDAPGDADDEAQREHFDRSVMAALSDALAGLDRARRSEGAALARILLAHVDEIERLTGLAEADPARDPAQIRARLAEQVGLLLDTAAGLDEARIYAEAAFLATKADIREELDRLKAHVAAAREHLSGSGPAGRKLDFLSQEFIRESNTLCSKSNAATITRIGLELKAVVDQFREQVQNLE